MPGQSGTVSLPRVGAGASVPGQAGVGFPNNIPGGVGGPAPIPSRLTMPIARAPGGPPIPGGRHGKVNLFTPAVDKQAPYFLGHNDGFSIRSTDGSPIRWWRRFFHNSAGVSNFQPQGQNAPNWSSNTVQQAPARPGAPVPMSNKHQSFGGYFREFYVDEQLFNQLTDRQHPWRIQNGALKHTRAAVTRQPRQTNPYPYLLTMWQPAAAYGQTTNTLLASALANLLPQSNTGGTNPPLLGGSPYGSY